MQGCASHAGVRRPGRKRRSHSQARAQALGKTQSEGDQHPPTAPMTWMERLRRVFAIDLCGARSLCPLCGGRLRVIADVTRPDVIQRILEHVAKQQGPPDFSSNRPSLTIH